MFRGEQPAILDRVLFDAVQAKLDDQRRNYKAAYATSEALLIGLDAALERLTASGLISRRGEPPVATYSFKHALVRDAAYATLLKSRRRQLHASIAKVLV